MSRHVLVSSRVAPSLVSRSLSLERKLDCILLEEKIARRPRPEEVRFLGVEWERGEQEGEEEDGEEQMDVKELVRRFSYWNFNVDRKKATARAGIGDRIPSTSPSRATVRRLCVSREQIAEHVS